MDAESMPRDVHLRLESSVYQALESLASQERRSVPQAAQSLLEESLRQRISQSFPDDSANHSDLAALAMAGGAFDWLAEEPDLYDDACGEPVRCRSRRLLPRP